MRFKGPYRQVASILLFLSLLLLLGCSGQASPEFSAGLPEPVEAVQPTAVAEAAVTSQDDIEIALVEAETVDECLSCHTDKDMLISTVAPEDEVISENEGQG